MTETRFSKPRGEPIDIRPSAATKSRDESRHKGGRTGGARNRSTTIGDFFQSVTIDPCLLCGDAISVLKEFPDSSVDCVMTSPPYWSHREYEAGGIGQEDAFQDYISNLLNVLVHVHRVLKPSGSLWLNIGDTYDKRKSLIGLPWRIALKMIDEHGWILRNEVIWNKVKGGFGNRKDRLESVHEPIFHFVKQRTGYYYSADAIRTKPREGKVIDGSVVSATGVRGVRYRRQIELSTELTEQEKSNAFAALEGMLEKIRAGELHDFRMMIRGHHRPPHSDQERVSGRARELLRDGFCFLRYHTKGSRPSDVWDILPEDTHRDDIHCAPYPLDLCRNPILASCPPDGVVLDPFCGTGTTLLAARLLNRRSIGIDVSKEYLKIARERISAL